MANAAIATHGERVWAASPPRGHEPVADLCRRLFDDLDALTRRMNAIVDRDVVEFVVPGSRLPEPDRFRASRRLIGSFLHGVAENRGLSEDQLSLHRRLGQRIATFEFPLQAMIASFHVTYRELWSLLVEEAVAAGGKASLQLLGVGATIWERMHAATTALAEGYHDEVNRREALKTRTSVDFVEALGERADSDECLALATELGFEPDGPFRVIAIMGPIVSMDTARVVAAEIHRGGATAIGAPRGRAAVLVIQGVGQNLLERALARAGEGTASGIGLEGNGLDGAHASLAEAERALELAMLRGGQCRFEEDWFLAGTLSHRASVERILSGGIDVAVAKPHLADAVRVFATGGFSLAESSRALHISQSSVRYRLRRWRALTGWDPWTHEGLVHSLMALELASVRSAPGAGTFGRDPHEPAE